MRCKAIAIAVAPLLLAACAQSGSGGDRASAPASAATTSAVPATSAPAAGMQRFHSDTYGFRIDYPAAMKLSRTFRRSYLGAGTWKTYAAPGSSGTPVVALILPGSNHVTAGELRIGVSQAPSQVQECDSPPTSMRPGSRGHARIGDVEFTRFRAGDAAMSHYLTVHSYRVVRAQRCYAIDLLVTGTNPQVYDPPKTPPFSQEQAFTQLQKVLQSFRFTR